MITKAKQLLQTEVTLDHESMLQRIKDLSEVVKTQNDWIERAKPFLIYFMDSDCCSEVEGVDIYQLTSEVQDVD